MQLSSAQSAASIGQRPCTHITKPKMISTPMNARVVVAHSQKGGGIGDDLLDFVTAGPKMRKWYGQTERGSEIFNRPEGEDPSGQNEEEEEGDGDAVLVTDADSPIGEQIVLQLILARAEIKVLVKDTVKAKTAYGPYVTPISIDTSNANLLKRALKGCGSVVCLGRTGALLEAAKSAGVSHILMLSAAGSQPQGGFLSSLFDGELAQLRDESREQALAQCGRRYSIVRVGSVQDTPGGLASISLQPLEGTGSPAQKAGPVSREDLAAVIVQALLRPPQSSRVFQVVATAPGTPPQDWSSVFAALNPSTSSAA